MEQHLGAEARRALSKQRKLVTFVAAIVCSFVLEGVCLSFSELYPALLEEFKQAGGSRIYLIGSLLPGIYLVVSPVSCLLLRWFGFFPVVTAGSILSSVGFISSSFVTHANHLIICYSLIAGLGFGAIHLSSMAVVLQVFNSNRGAAFGLILSISSLSGLAFTPFIRILLSCYGWRGTNLILGALLLNCIACSMVFDQRSGKFSFPKSTCQRLLRRLRSKEVHRSSYIMKMMAEKRERDREGSTGSLDGCVITTDNCLVRASQVLSVQQNFVGHNKVEDAQQNKSAEQYCLFQHGVVARWHDDDACHELASTATTVNLNYKVSSFSSDGVANNKTKANCGLKGVLVILQSSQFLLYTVSFVLPFIASFLLVMNLPRLAVSMGLSVKQMSLFMTVMWLCNSLFRIPVGLLCDRSNVSKYVLLSSSLLCCSALAILLPWISSYEVLMSTSVAIGMFMACQITLKPIFLMDMFDSKLFIYCYSISSFFQGLCTIASPLLTRLLTHSRLSTLTAAGIVILVGGLVSLPLKCLSVRRDQATLKGQTKKFTDAYEAT